MRATVGLPWAFLLELHGWYVQVVLSASSLHIKTDEELQVAHLHWNWRLYLHRGDRSSRIRGRSPKYNRIAGVACSVGRSVGFRGKTV
jgi:hypothetical protein